MSAVLAEACGIDFGASNSTAGWSLAEQHALLPLEDGKLTLPSVIFFRRGRACQSYGRAALADYLEGHEGRLMRSLKSLLDTSKMDEYTEVAGTGADSAGPLSGGRPVRQHRRRAGAGRTTQVWLGALRDETGKEKNSNKISSVPCGNWLLFVSSVLRQPGRKMSDSERHQCRLIPRAAT